MMVYEGETDFLCVTKNQQKGNKNLILWGSKVPCLRPPKPMPDPKSGLQSPSPAAEFDRC